MAASRLLVAPDSQHEVPQAKLAYRLFREAHGGEWWSRLAANGARLQRPLRASTSTKNPPFPDTLHVDQLIGLDPVSPLPENTIRALEDHGTLARTIDVNLADAERVMQAIADAGVDMGDVGQTLEDQGVAAFQRSFDHVLGTLAVKHHAMTAN
jgi:transaldolase